MRASSFDSEIMALVKEINPSGAYVMGFNDYAGKLFIASRENVDAGLEKVRSLRQKAATPLEKKVLDSIETTLLFDEPQPVLDDIVGTIFAHLVKEGVKDAHMLPLLNLAMKDVDACRARFSGREIPSAVKALTLYRVDGLNEILDTLKKETKSPKVRAACDALKAKVAEYAKLFELEGWGQGEFPNVESIFRNTRFDLGRREFYERCLKSGFDYTESPEELERNAMAWLDEELPHFRRVTDRLARHFGCKPTPEDVQESINSRMKLDPKELIKVTNEMRRAVQRFVDADVTGINPKYNTRVVETPPYLTGTIPSGAAQFFDTFTKKPFQIYFQTTDPKRDPAKSVVDLLNLLVHEEYGHCVHHSNSALGFVGKISTLQLLPATQLGSPITEGLSFNRELEYMEASKALEEKERLTPVESSYVRLLDNYGGLKQVNLEIEFVTRRWRITRFLRVIGDVWVNTGKRSLMEFVDWAHEKTGVPRSSVYFQLFPAHEGLFPGYATCYAVVGQEIRAMEVKIRDPKKKVKFSTYLCSIGFPPRTMYRKMLEERAAKLR